MYDINVNDGQFKFNLEESAISGFDVIEFRNGSFHIIHEEQSFTAQVVEVDYATKHFVLMINNKQYQLAVADKFDLLIKKMGLNYSSGQKINQVKAPMPGLVLTIEVETGQAVSKGDPLLILEAMKMENVIKSPGEGVVRRITVKQGDAVEKNTLLIEFE